MRIAFWDNSLCERGTTTALFDYAYYAQTLLGHTSLIVYDMHRPDTLPVVVDRFRRYFTVVQGLLFKDLDTWLTVQRVDVLYIIKSGQWDGKISQRVKTVVHCVFVGNQPHGQVYAAISPHIVGYQERMPVVPHMVHLPSLPSTQHWRSKLGIPSDAMVFGRHGGLDTFNVDWVQQMVYHVALKHTDRYFLFLNTRPFCPALPNIIHVPGTIDPVEKVEFIQTCDAMLWARKEGETFGLAIAEFSFCNKPVLAMNVGDTAHVAMLGDTGIWYDATTLEELLVHFRPEVRDWNRYRSYSPEMVMNQFQTVFLD